MKILIVDDHELIRRGLAHLLRSFSDTTEILEAESGEQAIVVAKSCSPDIILMDVSMPGLGGIEATRRIKRSISTIPVIMLSGTVDLLSIDTALAAGASGYISKSIGGAELEEAIDRVVSGVGFLCSEARTLRSKARSRDHRYFDYLSSREQQICLLIAEGTKVADIAASLALSPKTVNTYRYRIFEKLSVSSDVELALLIVQQRSYGVELSP